MFLHFLFYYLEHPKFCQPFAVKSVRAGGAIPTLLMKRVFFGFGLLCLSLFYGPLAAQSSQIDSLKNLLSSSRDTTRVSVLNRLAFQLVFSEPEQSEKYSQEALELAGELNFQKGRAHSYQVLGVSHDLRSNYPSAIDAYSKGLAIMKQIDPKRARYLDLHAALLNGIGIAYYHQSNYKEALTYFLESLGLAETLAEKSRLANILVNIGLVYHDQREFDKALEFYERGLRIGEEAGSKQIVGRASNNIGIIYKDKEKYDEAIRYYNLSTKVKTELGDLNGVSATLCNLGVVYKRIKKYDIAMAHLDSAATLKTELGDRLGMISVNDTKAEIYIQRKQFAEAKALIDENFKNARQIGARESLLLVYERYVEWHKVQGQWAVALGWEERRAELKDSLFNETKSKQIAEIQTQYEVAKKEKEIQLLAAERDVQNLRARISLIAIITVLVLATGVVFWFIQKQKTTEARRALAQLELDNAMLREGELKKELDYKNRELTSYTVNFIQKSKLMEEMRQTLEELRSTSDGEMPRKIQNISKIIDSNYQIDREWEDFKVHFEQVHSGFFDQLKSQYPDLTSSDLKLCALLKLNMNVKESAKILGISPDSVKTARYRLRKKLSLGKEEGLFDFMFKLENDMVAGA